ncbi:MAG: extracellular solute-binding protein [Clostridiaceae bacterium]|jgi:raffinose/stachyose/melibiose transport system substrate-binding protein|nr:extracellular solute-binding protein [Clostridiaceae bacterium]
MKKKLLILGVVLVLLVSMLAGCAGNQGAKTPSASTGSNTGSSGDKFQSRTIKFLSIWPEDDKNSNGWIVSELSRQYGETVDGFKLEYEYVAIDQLDQKVKILMSSDDLPEVCTYESGVRLKQVIDAGLILNVEETFTELGIRDCLDEGAVSLLKRLVDGKGLYCVPLGLNMEGFWYNKALFEKAGIQKAPETWDEFLEVCEKLKAAGITPIVQGGSDNWPMTRVLNAYLVRSVGPNAVQDAVTGKKKFTDPEYVAAAQMFQDMAKKGYFAEGMNTIDPGTATSMLMNGQAAMNYDGSWKVSNLNSDDNTAGPEGIGFFNVPVVNDSSTILDYSMNCGNILMFSKKKYDDKVADWMKYVFPKLGDFAMQETGAFKGFSISKMPEDTTYYTQLVAEHLAKAQGAFLWFEAKMDSETSTIAQQSISLLYTGEITAEDYMRLLEETAAKSR